MKLLEREELQKQKNEVQPYRTTRHLSPMEEECHDNSSQSCAVAVTKGFRAVVFHGVTSISSTPGLSFEVWSARARFSSKTKDKISINRFLQAPCENTAATMEGVDRRAEN